MIWSRLIREPLVHFFVLGAALFVVFAWTNRDALRAPDEIVVDNARVAALQAQFERVWQRAPTETELEGLIDSWVREEIMYREGMALGLEKEDSVIRRRIAQKLAFMADGLVDDSPSDAELTAWLEEHPQRYEIEPSAGFRQVFFDPLRHGEELTDRLAAAHAALVNDPEAVVGDATLLPARLDGASRSEVERSFGSAFASELFRQPVGEWAGPVQSGYGVHLVLIESVDPARVPALDEVRKAVARDLVVARRERAEEAFFEALRKRYEVIVGPGVTTVASGAE